jgi:tetratricopeptide (TPR) repeat protein
VPGHPYNRAIELHRAGKLEEAERGYLAVLEAEPRHVGALENLGVVRLIQERHEDAYALISRALALKPDSADSRYNCGLALHGLGRYAEALESYDRALALRAGHVGTLTSRANTLLSLGRYPDAIASCARALALKPDHPNAHLNESLARLVTGDFRDGWPKYEWRLGGRKREFPQAPWRGDAPLEGKTVLLHAEQGLGDTLQFLRYVPLVAERGARVVLRVQPELEGLAAGLPGVAELIKAGERAPRFDLHCPLPSLPLAFGTELATIPASVPYLKAPEGRAPVIEGGGRLRVGLAWSGNPRHANDRHRSIAFERLAGLLDTPGAAFVSLQHDVRPADQRLLAGETRLARPAFADFADTAAVVSQLDLVITVDSSVAHLAGALGRPVWILLPWAPDWRWLLERQDSPWYPSARLKRQPQPGDWDSVIARVARELGELVSSARVHSRGRPTP